MRKTKTQKGITLIALIITIVVLLILAVVAINTIEDSGLIAKVEEATGVYNQKAEAENTQLTNFADWIVIPGEESGLISFTITGATGISKTFQAESGMTWGQWVDSTYDVDDEFTIDSTYNVPVIGNVWIGNILHAEYVGLETPIEAKTYYLCSGPDTPVYPNWD